MLLFWVGERSIGPHLVLLGGIFLFFMFSKPGYVVLGIELGLVDACTLSLVVSCTEIMAGTYLKRPFSNHTLHSLSYFTWWGEYSGSLETPHWWFLGQRGLQFKIRAKSAIPSGNEGPPRPYLLVLQGLQFCTWQCLRNQVVQGIKPDQTCARYVLLTTISQPLQALLLESHWPVRLVYSPCWKSTPICLLTPVLPVK